MHKKIKIAIALSGGVDSSVAAMILKNQGYEVLAFTAKLFNNDYSSIVDNAQIVAKKLNIPFEVINLCDYFQENIISYFDSSYKIGLTPNPCILCNKLIKWGKLFDFAKSRGCDYIATGHYAKIMEQDGLHLLYPANNIKKDQLYFLFNLPKELLSKTIFPLASFASKDEIRKIAEENDLPSKSAKDSQDICFIQNTTSSLYIDNLIEHKKGDIVLLSSGKKIGVHNGAAKYTPGQRKGIGIAFSEPLYVIKTDIDKNIVYVGIKSETFTNVVKIKNLNIHDTRYTGNFTAMVKIRYNMPAKSALVELSENFATITFESPVCSVAKGQAAVFYSPADGHLIGGGFIY